MINAIIYIYVTFKLLSAIVSDFYTAFFLCLGELKIKSKEYVRSQHSSSKTILSKKTSKTPKHDKPISAYDQLARKYICL